MLASNLSHDQEKNYVKDYRFFRITQFSWKNVTNLLNVGEIRHLLFPVFFSEQ
jgi:hypothetical protein